MSDEYMTTSPTGGSKGQKLARFDLIPTGPLNSLARQYGRGAIKYDERNWERGYPWSLSYAAAMRHLNAFWDGENWDYDPEWDGDPAHHLDAAMFHIMALREFFSKRPEYDDRSAVRNRKSQEEAGRSAERLAQRFGSVPSTTPRNRGDVRRNLAESEQAEEGRNSTVQAHRWEIP